MHEPLGQNIEIFFKKNVKELLPLAQDELRQVIQENKNKPTLLLFSGGSAFSLLEADFSDALSKNATQMTIGVLDERFSKDPQENNFAQLMQTRFYRQAVNAGASVIDTRVRFGESSNDLADRYQQSLENWLKGNRDGFIGITQGMGSDKHTSGMMPHQDDPTTFEKLFQSQQLVVAYDAGSKDTRGFKQRVTTTITFFKHVTYSLLWVVGESKLEALQALRDQNQRENVAAAPANIIFSLPRVSLYTDQQF